MRLASALGSCKNARQIPYKLDRSGESPANTLKIALAHVFAKCEHKRGHSWMFFQQNKMKFFLRTDWM